jgi:ribosomal protein S18 acetylase RimI-like enzyme
MRHVDTRIRPFTPADAAGLLAVEQAIWRESPLHAREVAALAAFPEHGVWVAEAGEGGGKSRPQVVGFAWCFLTHTRARGACWELDLLAVHPGHRGRGLGTALVRAAYEDGRARGAARCRGIVAVGNTGSQIAFRRAGFTASTATRDLLARRVLTPPPPSPERAHFARSGEEGQASAVIFTHGRFTLEALRVHTLLYSGLWLESLPGDDDALLELLDQAEDFARQQGLRDITHLGILTEVLSGAGFRSENTYYEYLREYEVKR